MVAAKRDKKYHQGGQNLDFPAYLYKEVIEMQDFMVSTAISAVAAAIACHLSDEDLALTAAVFTQLGDSLATISVLRNRREPEAVIETETIV